MFGNVSEFDDDKFVRIYLFDDSFLFHLHYNMNGGSKLTVVVLGLALYNSTTLIYRQRYGPLS